MKDTSPEIEKIYYEMMMKRSGEERMRMAAGMFDAARQMALASFPKGLSLCEINKLLFERFYSNDFSDVEKKKIFARMDEYFAKLETEKKNK